MKKLLTFMAIIVFAANTFAQVPQKLSYQAVIRDVGNTLVTNHAVGMKISILQGSANGTTVYSETQTASTNANGLVSIEIGTGTPVTGVFTAIDWSAGIYFIRTETDPSGGTGYTITGTSQILSVPYALYSKTAETANYNNLTNLPALFNGTWSALTGKPATIAGYGITDAFNGTWGSLTGKPAFATVATSGLYSDLTGKPTLFSGSFTDLTNKPTTLSGYGITDAINNSHVANSITLPDITNWNTAYSWGNHAVAGYVSNTRKISINKIEQNLADNRSWEVGTVTSVDLFLPPEIFFITSSPVTSEGTLSAVLNLQSANKIFAAPATGDYGFPSFRTLEAADIPNLDWGKITSGKPVTLSGYGITDGVNLTGDQTIGGTKTFSSTVTGSISGNSGTVTNGVYTTGNQTISGNKTFTGTTTVPAPVNATDAATKAYVDALTAQIQEALLATGMVVRDYDGNLYTTVKIGTQVWLRENLKTTSCNDGTPIALVTENTTWANLTTPGYCWYNNDKTTYGNTYGALYNWYTINTGKLCPTGWHVPTDAEWTILTTFLGGDGLAAGKLKETGTVHWASPNTGATNESGFTALPAAGRWNNGSFGGIQTDGRWWSATEVNVGYTAWGRSMSYDSGAIGKYEYYEFYGFSIRCIKN